MSKAAEVVRPVSMVAYCDGSSKPNGSYSGYGVYGYLHSPSKNHKNIKHPYKTKCHFTESGIADTKGEAPIEVTHILEIVTALQTPTGTNNLAEISAVVRTLQTALTVDNLTSVNVITDSNYVVSSYNDSLPKWLSNGWTKQDGKEVAHRSLWQALHDASQSLKDKDVIVNLTWVKGHNGDYGNEMSDLLSNIGSNAARHQYETQTDNFQTDILNSMMSYAAYKAGYNDKDFIYFFKDLFFSTAAADDNSFCFICNTEDDREVGKRNNTSIFLANLGKTPEFVNKVRHFYRSLKREYIAPCSLKLSKLADRDKLRLTTLVDIHYLLRPMPIAYKKAYSFIGDDTVFLHENTVEFPFINNISLLTQTLDAVSTGRDDSLRSVVIDITDKIVKEGKLLITNTDRYLDYSDIPTPGFTFKQKLVLALGYDLPSYLALKNIESEITQASLLLRQEPGSNFCTLYVQITTPDRTLLSLNVPNKYLIIAETPTPA